MLCAIACNTNVGLICIDAVLAQMQTAIATGVDVNRVQLSKGLKTKHKGMSVLHSGSIVHSIAEVVLSLLRADKNALFQYCMMLVQTGKITIPNSPSAAAQAAAAVLLTPRHMDVFNGPAGAPTADGMMGAMALGVTNPVQAVLANTPAAAGAPSFPFSVGSVLAPSTPASRNDLMKAARADSPPLAQAVTTTRRCGLSLGCLRVESWH